MPLNTVHIDTWNSLLSNQQSSLEELYNQHYIGLLNYGVKFTRQPELTKDCIFQLFLTLWDNRAKLPPVTNVRSYLLTCLHRELLSHINKNKYTGLDNATWSEFYPDREFSYEDILIQSQYNRDIRKKVIIAFDGLSPREKELLRLKFFEDRNYDEIADTCNITKRTAYNIIHAALKTLKQSLNRHTQNKKKAGTVLTALKSIFF